MLTSLVVIVFTMLRSISGFGESFEVGDHTNVSLPCNYTKHGVGYPGILIPFKRYWMLPNGTVVPDTYIISDGRISVDRPTLYDFNLVILNVDDVDYGVYHCVMIWNNIDYTITTIPIGLNDEGPRYKNELKEFEKDVLIGGTIAGCVVLMLLVIGIAFLYQQWKRNKKRSFGNDITYQASDEHLKKYGYGGDTRKRPIEYGSSRPSMETTSGKGYDAEGYANVDKSRITGVQRSSPSGGITEQSARL